MTNFDRFLLYSIMAVIILHQINHVLLDQFLDTLSK